MLNILGHDVAAMVVFTEFKDIGTIYFIFCAWSGMVGTSLIHLFGQSSGILGLLLVTTKFIMLLAMLLTSNLI